MQSIQFLHNKNSRRSCFIFKANELYSWGVFAIGTKKPLTAAAERNFDSVF